MHIAYIGIWENQDYGTVSNYSTLKTNTRHQDNFSLLTYFISLLVLNISYIKGTVKQD